MRYINLRFTYLLTYLLTYWSQFKYFLFIHIFSGKNAMPPKLTEFLRYEHEHDFRWISRLRPVGGCPVSVAAASASAPLPASAVLHCIATAGNHLTIHPENASYSNSAVFRNLIKGVPRGYISGVLFQKCSNFSITLKLSTIFSPFKGRGQARGPLNMLLCSNKT